MTRMSGCRRVIAEFEADLVVALAGGAVRYRVGARFARDFDLALGDQRPCDRRSEQVLAFVDRVGAEHREDKVAHELLAQIVDVYLSDAGGGRLGASRRELLTLTDVGGEGNDFATVGILQPFQDHRRVEAAGIGKHHFLDVVHGSRPAGNRGLKNARSGSGVRGSSRSWRRSSRSPAPTCPNRS